MACYEAASDGRALPNLNLMGASSAHKDLFVEVNAMQAPGGTSCGSANAPYNSMTDTVTDAVGHIHMPLPDVVKMVGDVYAAKGITPHFDVGDIAEYHAYAQGRDIRNVSFSRAGRVPGLRVPDFFFWVLSTLRADSARNPGAIVCSGERQVL
jgi:hypothetical protein